MKKIIKILSAIIMMFTLASCETKLNFIMEESEGQKIYTIENTKFKESSEETNLVLINVKNKGAMVAELYPDIAPITVKNFKKLISENFYDGLTFHRVINNFMIQTGDPTGTGIGGSEENIKGEFELNGVKNNLSHTRGVLSMARRGANPDTEETMNSASSQFFIVHADSDFLDGSYASFGKVIHGLEVIDLIAKVQTDENDKPLTDVIIDEIIFLEEKEESK